MMAIIVTTVALIAVLVPCMAAKLRQARRDRNTLELWAIGGAIFFLTLGQALIFTVEFPEFSTGLSDRIVQLGASISIIGAYAALQLFYLTFVAPFVRRHRLRVEFAIVAVVAAVTIYVLAFAVPGEAGLSLTAEQLTSQRGAAVFYLLSSLYIAYVLGTQLGWIARFARRFPDPIFRAAALITAAGSAVLFIFVMLRVAFVMDAVLFAGRLGVSYEHDAVRLMVPVGNAVLALGLTLPVLVGTVMRAHQWIQSYHIFRRLTPLSQAIGWAFPELVRPERPGGRASKRNPPSAIRGPAASRLAMQLRLTQCRDGYTRLAPYLTGGDDLRNGNERASRLAKALQLYPHAHLSSEGDDIRQLCEISQALRSGGRFSMAEPSTAAGSSR